MKAPCGRTAPPAALALSGNDLFGKNTPTHRERLPSLGRQIQDLPQRDVQIPVAGQLLGIPLQRLPQLRLLPQQPPWDVHAEEGHPLLNPPNDRLPNGVPQMAMITQDEHKGVCQELPMGVEELGEVDVAVSGLNIP